METIQLIVSPGYFGYQAAKEDWDLGDAIGDGKTIQAAIEDWKMMQSLKSDVLPEEIKYKWRGPETPEWWLKFCKRKGIDPYTNLKS
jgi:hypothetical protein